MEERIVYLADRRRDLAERIQLFQDVLGVVVLVPAALARLRGTHPLETVLAVVELAAAATLVVSAVRELREELGHEQEARISVSGLSGGVVLLIESAVTILGGGKVLSPALLTAVVMIVLALLNPRMVRRRRERRALRLTAEGIELRRSRFRPRVRLPWHEVRSVRSEPGRLLIEGTDGRLRTIALRRYANAEEIRRALLEAARENGLPALESAPGAR